MRLTADEIMISEVESEQWDQLLEEFPHATVFHTLAWQRIMSAAGAARIHLAQAQLDGECEAVWPCQEMRKGPLRVLGSPLPGMSTAYMGPLFKSRNTMHAVIDAFFQHDWFNKPAFFAVKSLNAEHVDLSAHGFEKVLDFDTYCIDLTMPEDALWENLKSECRSRIRKAEKLGLQVREETSAEFVDEFWAMSIETFARTQIQPTFRQGFVEEMWRHLGPEGRLRVLSAWLDEERVGTLVLPLDNHTMYYWGGASYRRFRGLPAHNLLHWEAIKLAQRAGLERYDFVSTLGGAGRFKKTFGPKHVYSSTHWERSRSSLIAALKRGYESYLYMRQRMKLL
jgi:hypothetical protein